jgi:hypothetical protein
LGRIEQAKLGRIRAARTEECARMTDRQTSAATENAEAERRAAHMRQAQEHWARTLEARRRMFTLAGMWRICPDKRCARACACRGDLDTCLIERWHVVVPPEVKALLYKAIRFRSAGASPAEAMRLAEEEMEKHRAALAAIEAKAARV